MKIDEYSSQAITTLVTDHAFGDVTPAVASMVFGLIGESGEVAEKFKKLIRDEHGRLSDEDKQEIIKELGDVLWYLNALSTSIGSSLDEVASANLQKVLSRKARGQTHGHGDNR